MGLPDCTDPNTTAFSLTIRFEDMPGEFPGSRVYALDDSGEILDSQPVREGHAEMRLPIDALSAITLAIGPAEQGQADNPDAWHPLFTTDWQFEPGITQYALRSVPENVWRWWLVSSLHGTLWPARQRSRRPGALRKRRSDPGLISG